MNANVIPRRQRTQAEIEDSLKWDFWEYSVDFGMQYYGAGRFSAFAHFVPTCGNQFHHAVEFLLKACLAYRDPWSEIKKYRRQDSYYHDLEKLWAGFRKWNVDPALAEYDELIAQLNKFEEIRYPEKMRDLSRMFNISLTEIAPGEETRSADGRTYEVYTLVLPRIDRLVQLLFRAANRTGPHNTWAGRRSAKRYFWLHNTAPFLPKPDWIDEIPTGPDEAAV